MRKEAATAPRAEARTEVMSLSRACRGGKRSATLLLKGRTSVTGLASDAGLVSRLGLTGAVELVGMRSHADVIRRFGRFPHRNAILGRVSTPDEIAFLATPGSTF